MSNMISIEAGAIRVQAELNNTRTAQALLDILPVEGDGRHVGR